MGQTISMFLSWFFLLMGHVMFFLVRLFFCSPTNTVFYFIFHFVIAYSSFLSQKYFFYHGKFSITYKMSLPPSQDHFHILIKKGHFYKLFRAIFGIRFFGRNAQKQFHFLAPKLSMLAETTVSR